MELQNSAFYYYEKERMLCFTWNSDHVYHAP